jgi:CRISPR-associated protein Cmr2
MDSNKNNNECNKKEIFNSKVDWKLKLKAILHDPPYKILAFATQESDAKKEKEYINETLQEIPHHKNEKDQHKLHEKWADELLFYILGDECVKDETVELADHIASAQSRIIIKPNFKEKNKEDEYNKKTLVKIEEAYFIDIFNNNQTNNNKTKVSYPKADNVISVFLKLKDLKISCSDSKDKEKDEKENQRLKLIFLFLWRFYPEIFKEIEYSPADTRAPNHSIYDHLVQTSAITSALKYDDKNTVPAFLLFTIGPVQSFISKARKTSDLWAGSYMLSYLIWKTMEPLIDHFGPDIIIFPSLLNQPLVDKYLFENYFKSLYSQNPNFVYSTDQIFKEWYSKWAIFTSKDEDNEEIKKIKNELKEDEIKKIEKEIKEIEEKITIANFPNRFLAVIPYDIDIAKKCQKNFENELKCLAEKVCSKIKNINQNLKEKLENLKEKIENQLLSYFQVYWVIMPWAKDPNDPKNPKDVLEDYKKIIPSNNDIYQTVEGIIEHPYYKPANVGSAYPLILELTEKLLGSRKSIRDFIQSEQKDTKCDLCGEFEILDKNQNFWEDIKYSIVKENEKLCGVCLTKRVFPKIIKEELNLSEEIRFPSTSEMATIQTKRIINKEIATEFKGIFESIIKNKPNSESISHFISVPALKGNPLYNIDGQFLMEETYRENYLKREYGINLNNEEIKEIKNFLKKNNINPSRYYAILQMDGDNMGKWLKGEFNPNIEDTIHPKVKDALLDYSPELKKILSSNHPNSPSIHQAFSRRLSNFSLNIVRKIVEGEHYGKLVYSGGDDVLALLPVDEVLTCADKLQNKFKEILSSKASMSAGIVFVHHKYPLYLALQKVNQAEKLAKKNYDKDSFCLIFLTHSDSERKTGVKWNLINDINDLISKFKNEEISSIFPYQFLEIVLKLYDDQSKNQNNLKEILKLELKRLFFRKETAKNLEDYFNDKILPLFEKMDIIDFCNLLIISRKIAGELRGIK